MPLLFCISRRLRYTERFFWRRADEEGMRTMVLKVLAVLEKLPVGLALLKSVKTDQKRMVGKVVAKVGKSDKELGPKVVQNAQQLELLWRKRVQDDNQLQKEQEKARQEAAEAKQREEAAKEAQKKREQETIQAGIVALQSLADSTPYFIDDTKDDLAIVEGERSPESSPRSNVSPHSNESPSDSPKKRRKKRVSFKDEINLLEVVFFDNEMAASEIKSNERSNKLVQIATDKERTKLVDHKEGVALRDTHIYLEEIDDEDDDDVEEMQWLAPPQLQLEGDFLKRGSESVMAAFYNSKYADQKVGKVYESGETPDTPEESPPSAKLLDVDTPTILIHHTFTDADIAPNFNLFVPTMTTATEKPKLNMGNDTVSMLMHAAGVAPNVNSTALLESLYTLLNANTNSAPVQNFGQELNWQQPTGKKVHPWSRKPNSNYANPKYGRR
eukprot:Platyproteum_vivax@DN264_c0_g1_i1.p1